MKKIHILLPILFILFVSFSADNNQNEKNKLILELMKQSLKNYHYEAHSIDNSFSE